MTRQISTTCLLCLLLAGAGVALADSVARAAEDPQARQPLAVVGGDTLKVSDLDAEILGTLAEGKGPIQVPQVDPEAALKRLVQDRLLEQEGSRIGAEGAAEVKNQVEQIIQGRGVKALMDSVSAPPPGAATPNPDSLLGRTNVMRRYSHILVPDEATARTLRDSLNAGVPFGDLARRHSTDPNGTKGGDLGWAAANAYVEEFEAAARQLEKGQVTGPVKTKFGWHLLTMTDSRIDTLKSETMAKSFAAEAERRRRTEAVRNYVAGLRAKYGVTVNDSLLATLDFASKDAEVVANLNASKAVLAVLPTGRFTVAGLARRIRFQYFHGLEDHPDAAAIRNKLFDEWVTEALLTYESHRLGMDDTPAIRRAAKWEEGRLMREQVLKGILDFPFKPTDPEINAFYEAHRSELTPAPRVKLQSLVLADEAAARRFREQLDTGSAFNWLVERTPEAKAGPPPIPSDWIDPEKLELEGRPVQVGVAIGPAQMQKGWVVGQITAIEQVSVPPLADCRDKVLRMMRGNANRDAILKSVAALEQATPIKILDGAQAAVAARIEQWRTATNQGGKP